MKNSWAVLGLTMAVVSGTAAAAEAPITAVTVYSDRARVVRTAVVEVLGRQRVELPVLVERADAGSIRLESPDAEVQTVDLRWVAGDEAFPRDEARTVLATLAALDAEIGHARRDHQILATYEVLDLIEPALPGVNAPRPAPKLSSAGWGAVIAFGRGFTERMQARQRALERQLGDLARRRADLALRAQRLGAERRRGGWRVVATVVGKGKATLHLSYMVGGARWYPSYDIQLDPATQKVLVAFAGLVSQETGEDWVQSHITLSTAIPASTAAFPKVYTWKIGERERFIPRPPPYAEPLPPPPPSSPVAAGDAQEVERLRQDLLTRAAARPPGGELADDKAKEARGARRDEVRRQQQAEVHDQDLDAISDTVATGTISVAGGVAGKPEEPRPPPAPRPYTPASAAPAEAPSPSAREVESVAEESPGFFSRLRRSSSSDQLAKASEPALSVGIAPPPGYQPPALSPDLPAARAGGYDLSYRAASAETVGSGKGSRRVALFSRSFPVAVERRLFPDLAPEAAFLVAELKNPTGQPLPGGQAKLFVGADPAGVAQIQTVAAGETFTLPLGLDRAVKPIRNVKVVTTESGIISKDETSQYTVSIEIANPNRTPIRVRVVDQLPVTDDKDVKIELQRTTPAVAERNEVTGKLEWLLTVPAAGKVSLSFAYTLERPKGYFLHQ